MHFRNFYRLFTGVKMLDQEQDEQKATKEIVPSNPAQGQIWLKFTQRLDSLLDSLYRNRVSANSPAGIEGQVWGMPPIAIRFPWASESDPENTLHKSSYFLHYFQSQGYGPTTNECVTTSALMSMNIIKDWVALQHDHPIEADRSIEEYTRHLDTLGLRGWIYRFSTRSPLPGMMTPWQAVIVLKNFGNSLKRKYGKSYRVKLSARHKVLDLIEHLHAGDLILIHGAWQMTLDRNNKQSGYSPLLAFLGGMPHTMLLIGYDGDASQWLLLNPADPWPADKLSPVIPKIYKMNTRQLMDFWGRKFLFYPPRFALTTITMDT